MEANGSRTTSRLIVVSNRLPYMLRRAGDSWELGPGEGGLVTALHPVLRHRGGTWVGWSGTTEEVPELEQLLVAEGRKAGYKLKPVTLGHEEVEGYYHGYSNEIIWPLFHDLQSRCNFAPEYWDSYVKVNRRFAEATNAECGPGDFVWVHDYHLMDLAHHLRDLGCLNSLAFFLHIPFPAPDIFLKLPERHALLSSLLSYDFLGVQTERDRRNLVQCIRMLVKASRARAVGHLHNVCVDGRDIHVGSFPVGIDADGFARSAASPLVEEMARAVKDHFGESQLVLGVDRLDYTKGIPYRLRAFADLLQRFPELRERITLIQVVVPSRVGVPEYEGLKTQIEQLVAEINGRYSSIAWVPIHYMFRSLAREQLVAYYRACDIALVTPLKDGMNLVCKEFCACALENDSVLILSQFAGAATQLGRSALLVNPYDVEQTADAIYNAFRMPPEERRARMRRLRRKVHAQNIFWWVDSFVSAAIHRELRDFPVIEEQIPEYHDSPA